MGAFRRLLEASYDEIYEPDDPLDRPKNFQKKLRSKKSNKHPAFKMFLRDKVKNQKNLAPPKLPEACESTEKPPVQDPPVNLDPLPENDVAFRIMNKNRQENSMPWPYYQAPTKKG